MEMKLLRNNFDLENNNLEGKTPVYYYSEVLFKLARAINYLLFIESENSSNIASLKTISSSCNLVF